MWMEWAVGGPGAGLAALLLCAFWLRLHLSELKCTNLEHRGKRSQWAAARLHVPMVSTLALLH